MSNKPFIVLCGMDGTGKSTLAEKVSNRFYELGMDVWLYHGHGYSVSQNSFGFADRGVRKYRYIFRFLVPFAYLDNLFTYVARYKFFLKKKVVICDRYFYDKVARLLYYGICTKRMAKIYVRLLPKPDYIFFLDIPPGVAAQRKQEYSEAECVLFREAYTFIAECVGATLLDTTESLEKTIARIHEVIRPVLAGSYHISKEH